MVTGSEVIELVGVLVAGEPAASLVTGRRRALPEIVAPLILDLLEERRLRIDLVPVELQRRRARGQCDQLSPR
jgi:hypothetical protein